MTDVNVWWDGLSDDDRNLFLQHRATSPLPAEVVTRAAATGQPTAGAAWVSSQRGATFEWPSWVREFLEKKAAEQTA
ncbi:MULTISPECIES: hypothetical protein [unclassified Micromonospora]|uniref:hypothetical protein n=1 Tax=unclassified Micromonospora TaxID=2617518 RepID=UPI00331F4965